MNNWEKEFSEKASYGFFGAHIRDEDADWQAVRDFIQELLESKAAEIEKLMDTTITGNVEINEALARAIEIIRR